MFPHYSSACIQIVVSGTLEAVHEEHIKKFSESMGTLSPC